MFSISNTTQLKYLPDKFYLFSFGANDPHNLAKRFYGNPNIPASCEETQNIFSHTEPAFLKGYVRSFFGYSKAWGGSVGTLIETKCQNKGVYGTITLIKHIKSDETFKIGDKKINFEALCNVEAINSGMYILQKIGVCGSIDIFAFIGNIKQYYTTSLPSERYLEAIAKLLRLVFCNIKIIEIPIRLNDNDQTICIYASPS